MRSFWKGFRTTKTSAPVRLKKHVIILYFSKDDSKSEQARTDLRRVSMRYPSVKVKVIDVKKDPLKPARHKISSAPTIILLRDGREVDRMSADGGQLLLEHLFRKAQS